MRTIYEYDTEEELLRILNQALELAKTGTPLIEIKPSNLYFDDYADKLAKKKK